MHAILSMPISEQADAIKALMRTPEEDALGVAYEVLKAHGLSGLDGLSGAETEDAIECALALVTSAGAAAACKDLLDLLELLELLEFHPRVLIRNEARKARLALEGARSQAPLPPRVAPKQNTCALWGPGLVIPCALGAFYTDF